MSAPVIPWDTSALATPLDRGAIRAAARRTRPGGVVGALGPAGRPLAVAVVLGLVVLLVLGSLLASLPAMLAGGGAFPILALVLIAAVVAGVAAAVIGAIRGLRRWDEKRMRLSSFAAANGFAAAGTMSRPALPGLLFHVGDGRRSEDVVRIPSPRWTEVGNYRYSTGRGRDRVTHESTLDPATWERVHAVLVALDGKLGQWARWRDERADAPFFLSG